jgi:arylformamidase
MALFIHGGYWQALGREWVSFCARGLNLLGVAVAVPSYDLCPSVPLATILAQMQEAAAFLYRRHGVPLLAAGHSAGGHLAACLLATDWPALDPALPAGMVASALPVSGLFELEPLLPTSVATALRLSREEARRLSPRSWPSPGRPLHAVVGGAESGEYLRQSREMAAAWGGSWEALPGEDHFTVLAPFADPAHPVTVRAAAIAFESHAVRLAGN